MRRGVGCLLLAMGLALPVRAEEAATPPPEAKLNDLTVGYTMAYQLGSAEQAILVAEQALAVAEEAFGPDDERVAQVLNDLGRLHQVQKELEPAEQLHERALKIRERLFNGDGPAVVQSLNNLAKTHAAQGHYPQAQALFERSLTIAQRRVSSDDPFLLSMLEPYAAALRGGGKLEAAKTVEARVTEIRAAQAGKTEQVPSVDEVLR